MRRSVSYPKDNEGKVREANKQLRAEVRRLRKENEMLRREFENIQKPVRTRKEPVVPETLEPPEKYGTEKTPEEARENFRKDFIKRFRPKGGK